MIDTLLKHKKKASQSKILKKLGLEKKNYCALTLHRPSNVDKKEAFENILSIPSSLITTIAASVKVSITINIGRLNKLINLFL